MVLSHWRIHPFSAYLSRSDTEDSFPCRPTIHPTSSQETTMRKLRLNPEELVVESFALVQTPAATGTVRGHDTNGACEPQEPDSINVCTNDPAVCGTGTGTGTGTTTGTTTGTGTNPPVTFGSPSGANTCAGYNTCGGWTCEEIYGCAPGPQVPGC
jgi:hypothetical protein